MRVIEVGLAFALWLLPSSTLGQPNLSSWDTCHPQESWERNLRVEFSEGRFGYIDGRGAWKIRPRFDMAAEFHEGLAAVQVGENWGYIDRTGKFVIPPRFRDAGSFSEGLAAVQPYAAVRVVGFTNKDGRLVIQPDYGGSRGFCDGRAAVWTLGKWGYIDRKGHLAIQPRFYHAFDFRKGLADVITEQKDGFHQARIDRAGNEVWISPFPVWLID